MLIDSSSQILRAITEKALSTMPVELEREEKGQKSVWSRKA